MLGHHFAHISLVFRRAIQRRRTVLVDQVVVSIAVQVIIIVHAPAVGDHLDLAGLGRHDRFANAACLLVVTLATGLVHYGKGVRCRGKMIKYIAVRRPRVGQLRIVGCARIAAMTDNTTVGITQIGPQHIELARHQ